MWQERPSAIVMLTNCEEGGKVKCEQYWPESGNTNFGPFHVIITDKQILADYTIRKLVATVRENLFYKVHCFNEPNLINSSTQNMLFTFLITWF